MKVGIITLYNNNNNYGGMAQAYALQQYIEKLGYDCKVINYKRTTKTIFGAPAVHRSVFKRAVNKLERYRIQNKTKRIKEKLNQRNSAMKAFREESIPHTIEYTDETIGQCAEEFDIFVSGSDQIWKPFVIRPPFVLDFVPDDKPKIAYASSISQDNLPDEYGEFMKKYLASYDSINVREKGAQEYLSKLLKKDVGWVTDPVLLLDEKDWLKIASERICNEKYVFCYILGDSSSIRKEAEKYARENNLKLITLPFLQGKWRASDQKFGDLRLFDIGMGDFLSLIKNSECVITDSFHAVAFSYIFKKEFYVFSRVDKGSKENMNSRINSFLELMNEQERFVSSIVYDEKHIDYLVKDNSILETKRHDSRRLLSDVLFTYHK